MIGSAHRTVKRLMGLANLTLLHPVPTLQRSFAMPSKSKTEWSDNTLDPLRAKRPERKGSFGNTSGMEVEPLYATEDVESEAYVDQVGYPGEFPYTRGVQPTMYRGRVWTMRQYAGFASAEESNARYKFLLNSGQSGLSVAFDLPTQTGYDSDHLLAEGEVGRAGVPISSLADMEALFDGIPLDKVTTSMTINSTASILLALYIAVARKQGVPMEAIGGTIQNDILKEYIARGTYIYPPKPSMRLVTDSFRFCVANVPRWNTISISGYHMREAGANAVQELAFTFSNAIAYVQAAVDSGLDVDDFGPRLSFFFVAQNDLFEEVAKFRAARRMWAKIMRDRFGAENPRSWMCRFHTQTAGVTLTAQQPDNNVIRSTMQALAAVLGGTQSLHVNSKDEALALPTAESAELSLRTQQVLANESGITETVDPLAGSYYVESLTDRLEEEAADYIRRIDEMDGALGALGRGFPRLRLPPAAGDRARRPHRGGCECTPDRTATDRRHSAHRPRADPPPVGAARQGEARKRQRGGAGDARPSKSRRRGHRQHRPRRAGGRRGLRHRR